MKIKKLTESKIITEEEDIIEPAKEVAKEEAPIENGDIKNATTDEIVSDMAAGAVEAGQTSINVKAAEKDAEAVKELTKGIRNPYGTGKMSDVEDILQNALETALDDREAGFTSDYPNVIIYGLAGFGKTAGVEAWINKHKGFLHYKEVDAKNMDAATVGGIPYPKADAKTGELYQAPVASRYWDDLDEPNTILVLDEFNRANSRTVGSFLTLINNHKLPVYSEDSETGEVKTMKKYNNILFTIIMFNPASDVFPDAEPFDPAVISRNIAIWEVKPNKVEFFRVLRDDLYSPVLNNPILSQPLHDKYEGQFNILEALLRNNPLFKFETTDQVRNIYKQQRQGNVYNYLNYRTLFGVAKASNGTKADFLKRVDQAHFSPETTQMFKNALSGYTDKISHGNSAFTQSTNIEPERQAKEASTISDLFSEFENALGN